jgi:hypothetical protein
VDHHDDRVRRVRVRPEQLADASTAPAVVDPLRAVPQAVTPSDRTASASRATPSSICSGVTPE